ncbi:hypothetical protein PRIPAC_76534 [Pristionchus pacificus]|uniref:RING-type E3 ubiquitin transferase n=1 Tax=Pristionchus pacificus TaxID=54126 RepID=A0A2A6CA30_PRIPA|nr:hypothetical protein PRIPAC_76534 [Pristionchus pacificus]|eukprot:PDM75075.1 zinc finger protein [Pristionchus pacificus]
MIQMGDTRPVAQADGRGFSKLEMEAPRLKERVGSRHRRTMTTNRMKTTTKPRGIGLYHIVIANEPFHRFECNICLDTAKDAVVSHCGHLFCWPCLVQWLDTRPYRQLCTACKALTSCDTGNAELLPCHSSYSGISALLQDPGGGPSEEQRPKITLH